MLDFIVTNWVKIYAIISLCFYLLIWVMKKTYASKEWVERLDKRLTKIEDEVKHLPKRDDLHQLELIITNLSGKVDGIARQLDKINRTTDMLLENELQGDKK